MAAHIGVNTTFGITLPEGAEAQSASKTETIEESVLTGANGEYAKAAPLAAKKVDVSVTYVGAPMHEEIEAGAVADPSTLEILESDATEQNKGRVTCTVNATSHVAFAGGAGASVGAGEGGPDEDTLHIVSSTLSLCEQVNIKGSVQDKVLLDKDGEPAHRQKHGVKNTFAIRWKGDPPANVTLGLGGIGAYGLTGGVLLALKLGQEEKNEDWNGGSSDGSHYPVAA